MDKKIWNVGLCTSLLSFALLFVAVRLILGQSLEVKNYLAFAVFGLIVGLVSMLLLFYKLRIAFPIFIVSLSLGFLELFRSFIMNKGGFGDLAGILSLFILTSFGLGIAVFIQFIVIFIRKTKS